MDFKIFYADKYEVPLPEYHRFPMEKYRLIRKALINKQIVQPHELHLAPLATINHLKKVHCPTYVDQVAGCTLDHKKARKVGLPLTPEMFTRTLGSMGGFLAAVEHSRETGFSSSLSGGTHHAHYDQGEGFCFFNDFAIASHELIEQDPDHNILILDLDVHQGNGNATMLKNNSKVFVTSFHGAKNYPFRKPPSDLDIEFEQGAGDDIYLAKLSKVLNNLSGVKFTQIFYQAGTDGLTSDAFGTLNLTFDGLKKRDQLVFEFAKKQKIPLAMALGGGYAEPISETVEATLNTYRVAKKVFS